MYVVTVITFFFLDPCRAFEEEGKARMGVLECANHRLLEPYPVLYEKDGEFVAQFKFTVLIMPTGPLRITQGAHHPEFYQSQYSIQDPEIKVRQFCHRFISCRHRV